MKKKQIAYEKAVFLVIVINQKINNGEDYTDQIFKLLNIMIKAEQISDVEGLTFDEFFFIVYNCLHRFLLEAESREDYEICATTKDIILNEEGIYRQWVKSLPEDDREYFLEELEYTQLALLMERERNGND